MDAMQMIQLLLADSAASPLPGQSPQPKPKSKSEEILEQMAQSASTPSAGGAASLNPFYRPGGGMGVDDIQKAGKLLSSLGGK